MNFWIYAIALLVVSAAIISWPLFTGSARERIIGLFILLMTPLAGIMLYQSIGTPEALGLPSVAAAQQSTLQQSAHSAQQDQMEELVASLQQRMNENPDDPEGWLILGRSLKTMQRYPEAVTALSNANRLVPGNPLIMVELAETRLFASGKPQIDPEVRQLIESALAIDPKHQKGLWLMGMASAQDGDETQAIVYWKTLLEELDPASGPYQTVTRQIEMAQTRMGQPAVAQNAATEPPLAASSMPNPSMPNPSMPKTSMLKPAATEPATTPPVAGFGIPVSITAADDLAGTVPASAALFIFIHPAGGAGMPLAVKRLAPHGFPMSVNFTDADLLRPGGSLQDFEQLDISARISMAGIANSASGDIQANRVTLDTKNVTAIALNLDQRVP